MRFIISDESVNRYGYRILSRGMSTASFEKNPVVFYNHGTFSLPIGKGKNLQHEVDGTITLDIELPGSWPTGKYKLELFVDGASIGAHSYEIKP